MPPAVSRILPFALPAALAVALLVGFVSILERKETHLAGTNSVALRKPVLQIARGHSLCQRGEVVPSDAVTLRLFGVWGPRGPHARATLRDRSGRLVSGGALERDGEGALILRLAPDRRTVGDVTLCVTNADRAPLALSGVTTPILGALIDGKTPIVDGEGVFAEVTALYYPAHEESWASLLPRMVSRVGSAHLARGWIGWLALASAVAALALALAAAAAIRPGRSHA
jgi:hypothetical protein